MKFRKPDAEIEYRKEEGFYSTKTGEYTTFELPDEIPGNPAPGIFPRLVAFVIDLFIVSIAGVVLGIVFGEVLIKAGPWARLAGILILLGYFGFFNSISGKGQTPGKRFMKLKVTGIDRQPVPVATSILRAFVLTVPLVLARIQLPPGLYGNIPAMAVLNLLFFGVAGAVVYLFVFNTPYRQSLHDIIAGTIVVGEDGGFSGPAPPLDKTQKAVTAGIMILMMVIPTGIQGWIARRQGADPVTVARRINQEKEFWGAGVRETKTSLMGGRGAGKSLSVRVNFTGSANHQEGAMDRTASILMKEYPGARDTDFITVTVLRGFNLGFFARHSKRSLTMRPDEWLTRVR